MSLQLVPSDRRILLGALGVLLILVGTALLLARASSGEDADIPSTYSTASNGCKAAFLLLQESGYKTKTWERPLSDLPDGKGKILILAEPSSLTAQDEKAKLEAFLKSGGRVIAAGRDSGYYLPLNEIATEPTGGTASKRRSALTPSPITRVAPEITMSGRSHWKPETGVVGLYGTTEKPVVVEYAVGQGEVLWLAASAPLTNAGIKEPGDMEFLLAAVGSPDQNEVLWDEYVHGYQRSQGTAKSSRLIGWILLQFAILAAAILFAYSRRSGPIWIPAAETRLSPLEFVRTLGSLYEHANAGSVALDISYQRFRYLLTRRLGMPANASAEDLARLAHERFGIDERDFANTLSECGSYRYDPSIRGPAALHLVQKIFDFATRLKLNRSRR